MITLITKNYGKQVINPDTFVPAYAASSSTAFKVIEHIFNDWFEHHTQPGAPMGRDIQGMYYGEYDQPAIYSKAGAIRQGIEIMIEVAQEKGLQVITTKDLLKMDIECAFE